MSRISPTLEGFRAAFHRPALAFAEIAWRWTTGAVAWTLFLFWLIEYLNTLPVSQSDATLLGTRQPVLVGKQISHILRGSLDRAVSSTLIAILSLAVLWIMAASLGRATTLLGLFNYFREEAGGSGAAQISMTRSVLGSLVALNSLRAAMGLAAILAFAGAAILAGFASPRADPQPVLAVILFVPFAAAICIFWEFLHWLLSLASVFAVRDGDPALDAIAAAVTLSQERGGPIFAVSAWTGMAHLVAFSVASTALPLPLAFLQLLPLRLAAAIIIFLALVYFAIVDWLYVARLGGYIFITENRELAATPATLPAGPPAGLTAPPQTAIDRDEPILSDLPNLAAEL